jgi:glycosyltransferase involved in cell wall biosynthesis
MKRPLRVLYIAYPLLRLSDKIAGGAEQVLLTLAQEMSSAGHDVTIAAAEGSTVPGRLLATGAATTRNDDYERRNAEHESVILTHLAKHEYDIVHDMSGSFWQQIPALPNRLLSTLHLPPEYYPSGSFPRPPEEVLFNGVSHSQARRFASEVGMDGLRVLTNGIRIESFPYCDVKQNYLLWLGRICEEKAPHLACDLADELGTPLVIAGEVYPFSYHQHYFETKLRPRLSSRNIRFMTSLSRAQKVQLLADARALLITSLAEETSSLVGMEAMACGTPVIAFRKGALPEVARDSVTGFIADNEAGMRESVLHIDSIQPLACREHVARHYSSRRMAKEYLNLYAEVAKERQTHHAIEWHMELAPQMP